MHLFILFALVIVPINSDNGFEDTLGHIRPQISGEEQEIAVFELIKRVINKRAEDFQVEINDTIGPKGKDTFKVEKTARGKIKITGTSGIAIATGFHYYLKYFCKCHISWDSSQLNLPLNLPEIESIIITSQDKFRYYQNVCTTSYSFVWWDWRQWERHIDWMALNSFNLVLAFNGQEAIWERVYHQIGLTQEEINGHFSGPAFLSWNRMGNIRGWGGPLSKAWHSRSIILQKQILKRMRELGIIAVLPAFAGQVPRAFKRLFPEEKMYDLPRWNKFQDNYAPPYLLDPTGNVFKKVGAMFLTELISEFGTDHVYNCDTFNEMVPFTSNTTYLKAIGESIFAAMVDVDAQAIWLMQGWMFYSEQDFWTDQAARSLILSVPLGKMIILDLQSEQFPQYDRLESYFGQPYIWCMLHNFGGTLGMFGSTDIINERIFEARSKNSSTMIGTGIAPEGINQNYVIYDLMNEMGWKNEPAQLGEWFAEYTIRRYGSKNVDVITGWEILRNTVYNYKGLVRMRGKYAYNVTPRTRINTWSWYNTCEILEAWDNFLDAAKDLKHSQAFQHDLVDLTRQVLQNFGDEYYNKLISSFKKKNATLFQRASSKFLDILDDADRILGTNGAFLLGRWLNDAKKAATNEEDAKLFEYNARNQITLWGPKGEIKDYANKQWSGIVSNFFKPRWSLFLKYMNDSLINQVPFKESQIMQIVFDNVEAPFTFNRNSFPDEPMGDTVEIALEIRDKWRKRGHCRVQRSQKFDELRPRVILAD